MVAEFEEDLDGDGVRDLLFFRGQGDNAANFVLSGRTGSPIVRFVGDEIAVGQSDGVAYFAVDNPLEKSSSAGHAGHWVFFTDKMGSFQATQEEERPGSATPEQFLMQYVDRPSAITVYRETGGDRNNGGVRIVRPAEVAGWDYWRMTPPGGFPASDTPAEVTPSMLYVPLGVVEWWEDRGGRFPALADP